jgi:glucose/arabinose dehydrogenase
MSFGYDAKGGGNILSDEDVIVNMANADKSGHETRTVLASKFQPGWLLVSKGSDGNIDLLAQNISTGHSTIKYFPFDVTPRDPADHAADGFVLAAGVRNSVGVAEHPIIGSIVSGLSV